MSHDRDTLGKSAYAALFVLVVPALLVAWSAGTSHHVLPAVPGNAWVGILAAGFGAMLMTLGVAALWVYGHGLPMGPYPPPVYVFRSVYRFTPHPIYLGFSTTCFGAAMALGSPSGFWLVAPCVALGCVALVLGFERREIRRRFSAQTIKAPLIALPSATADSPSWWDRASVVLLVLLPWALAYEAVNHLGAPPDAIEIYLPFERDLPVLEWSEAIYASAYPFVLSALLIAPTGAVLRRFAVTGLLATALVIPIYLTVPFIAPPRPFEPQTLLGEMLLFERQMSNTVAAFPAFHVVWSMLAAAAWAARSRLHALIGWSWALAITISCITTGMHAIADLLAAVVLFPLLQNYRRLWCALRQAAESLANSWREWRWGGVRFISHGVYAGAAGCVSLFMSSCVAGPAAFWQLVLVHVAALLGAGLWAQTLEGSSRLSRPFGYYGCLLGTVIATVIVGAVGNNILQVGAAVALAAPWVQAVGRLRCLVQGCCHGDVANAQLGIRYWKTKSRVCSLADLRGVPLHPTPLYSMLANVVVGVLLLRLWSLEATYALILGTYFILTGAARFVEEAYRGEPQTPHVAGLRIYQWLALFTFVAGAAVTAIPASPAADFTFWYDARLVIVTALFTAAAAFAMGVDFPASHKRFARLAPP